MDFLWLSCTSKSEYPAADSHQLAVPRKGKSDAADARRPPVQAEVCINDGKKGAERVHLAQSSSGRLFRKDTTILYSLSSHSLKQCGQLGEILGGVRFPEGGASRWLV